MTQGKSFKERFHDIVNDDRVTDVLKAAADVCGHIIEYKKNPSWGSAARIGIEITKNFVEHCASSMWSDDYFPDKEWEYYTYDRAFLHIIYPAIMLSGKVVFTTKSKDDEIVRKVDVDGEEFGFFLQSSGGDIAERMYVKRARKKQVTDLLPIVLRKYVKSDTIVLQRKSSDDDEGIINLVPDPYDSLYDSELAGNIESNVRRFVNADINRSILMYGIAGTGKSTLARVVIKRLGFRALRIKVEDIGDLNVTSLKTIIECLKPEAVLIDDFDRSHDQRRLLEIMECFNKTVKLVIATVNNRNLLDESIMRPGRFDELIEVNKLDPAVVKIVLGEFYDEETFNTLRDWPIAFINEYVIRRKIMSNDEAKSSIIELTERIERLKSENNGGGMKDDVETFLSVIKQKRGGTKKAARAAKIASLIG